MEKNKLIISGKGILEATKKGTRKYARREIARPVRTGLLQKLFPKFETIQVNEIINPGEVVYRVENHNIICNEGLQLVAGFLIDESAVYDVGLTYCEIGTDNTAPAAGDVTLTTYHGRKAVTTDSRAAYEDTFATFFTAAESTCAIEEAGMWGGNDAAAGEATGLLFSHFLVSFDNSGGLYDVTITYVLTVARG